MEPTLNENHTMSLKVRTQLSAMMFFQFMMLAVWFVPLAAYLDQNGVQGTFRALILSSMPLGCLVSPIIGMLADRHFAGQKLLFLLNLLGAILLAVAATVDDPTVIFILLLLQMLCYMPTWGLTSAIAMAHSPTEKFPQIRVFGSIGWVAAGLFSLVAIKLNLAEKFDGTNLPMYCGAATSLVGAMVALTLPDTPPKAKGQKASLVDVMGLRAFSLMKSFDFAVFIIVSLLVMIPFASYWSYGSQFLSDEGFEYITITMNWGQLAEMFFMLLIPLVLAKVGIRWAMVMGLIALVARYASFLLGDMFDMTELYFVAILVHGLIFGFFFVGGQIYIDKKAPVEIRAQAQGAIFLVTFGVGLLLGNFVNEWMIQQNTVEGVVSWAPVWKTMTIGSVALLVAFLLLFRGKDDVEEFSSSETPAVEAAS
ncbi:putative nucleoside transporter YegT [Planctomycetes bacterium CA13]|uniref:Putative nucleoside transporter YegT n=1 Tax=Novipirellula herctigrandis TaxID=2527986 RepID=A0A5C5YYZ4_9BACT|nr:putative nucleoside transporter YegT [Planctomycetes bacterium CA13]